MFSTTELVSSSGVLYRNHKTCVAGASLAKHAPTVTPCMRHTCVSTLHGLTGTCPAASNLWTPQQLFCRTTTCTAATAAPVSTPAAATAPSSTHKGSLRGLYPPSTPHSSGHLRVSDLHSIYYEVYGNPQGMPAVVLHGGPGAGCYPNHARFFDPAHYRIILLDQRGCGRSTPTGCLVDNNTAALVNDLEALRQHLGVQQWVMTGGSWGVALAIAYAQAYPAAVAGLILRGVCLMRPPELQWMYGGAGGAAALRPLAWAAFTEQLPENERANLLLGYYKRMLSGDANVRQAAAKAWMSWEMAVVFSNNEHLLVWNGQQWDAQTSPAAAQQQQEVRQLLPPPPRPSSAAAADARAAAAAGDGILPVWRRGVTLPDELLPSCGSSSNDGSSSAAATAGGCRGCLDATVLQSNLAAASASDGQNSPESVLHNSVITTGPSGPATPSNTTLLTAAAAAANDPQQQQQQRPAWVWGLPAQGYNLHDPEVCSLIDQGLRHTGFSNSAAQALLECHYSLHGAFLLQQPLLDHIDQLRHIPCIAIQGQVDFVCPPTTALELSRAWPEMELTLVPNAGHSMYDPGIMHEILCATDRMRALGSRQQQQQQQRGAAAASGRVRRIAGYKNW